MRAQILDEAVRVRVENQLLRKRNLAQHLERRSVILHLRLKMRVRTDDNRHTVLFAAQRNLAAVRDIRLAHLKGMRVNLHKLVVSTELRNDRFIIVAELRTAAVADNIHLRIVCNVEPKLRAFFDRGILKPRQSEVVNGRHKPVDVAAFCLIDVERAVQIDDIRLHARNEQNAAV